MKEVTATNPTRQQDAVTVTKPNITPAGSISRIEQIPDTKNQTKPVASSASKPVAAQSPRPAEASAGAAAAAPAKSKVAPAKTSNSNDEQIRQRAYELYVESGYQDGHAEEHWFAAENEIQKKAE